jgi:uncharacterized SAM-binding protein YcdF (DUF218 family)
VTDEIHPATCAAPRFRAAKRALVIFSLLAAFCAAVWFGRETLLRGAAELWVVSDTVAPADAVAIFGGGLGVRPFAAAEYYKKGITNKILVSNVGLEKAELLGIVASHTALNRSVLLKLGVPETAIETFGFRLSNTYQEAVALREWAVRTHARSVIVPTQAFSSRRVRWVVERELAGTGIQVNVPPLDDTAYGLSDWWKDEKAVIEFQNEVLKYVYYRFKY